MLDFLIIISAAGVISAIYQMRRQAREHKRNREKLRKFEQEHPGR